MEQYIRFYTSNEIIIYRGRLLPNGDFIAKTGKCTVIVQGPNKVYNTLSEAIK